MPQILPKYSFGAELGSGIGRGFGSALSYLAQNKLGEMSRANEMRNYSNLLQTSGLDARDADVLAYHAVSNPQSFHHILEQYIPRQSQQPISSTQQLLQSIGQQGQPQYQEQQPSYQAAYRQPTPEQSTQLNNLFRTLGVKEGIPSGMGQGMDLLREAAANQLLKTAVGQPSLAQEQAPARQAAIQQAQQQQALQQAATRVAPQAQQQQLPSQVTPQQLEDIHPLIAAKQQRQQLAQQKELTQEQTKKQKVIDKANEPFIKNIQKAVPIAEEMNEKAQEMLRLLETGKVNSGIQGKLTPGFWLNEESQRFLALSNDIASLLAANSGVATNFKIKFAQERKPNLSQKPQTQLGLTEDIIKQSQKVLLRERISNRLIEENDNQQPPNLKTRVDSIYKEQKNLPPADQYSDDAIIQVGNKVYRNDNGLWNEVRNA